MTQQLDFFEGVKTFNVASGTIAAENQPFDAKLVAFYTGMQCEELAEKLAAIFGRDDIKLSNGNFLMGLIDDLEQVGHALKNDMHTDAVRRADRVDLLDADVDIQVVTEGSILASGANGDGARAEVNRSNLAKIVDGKVIRDPVSGKILKPEGWTKPVLEPHVGVGNK